MRAWLCGHAVCKAFSLPENNWHDAMSSDGLCKIGNAWWFARHVWYHTEYEGSPHDKDGLEPTPMKEISMRAYIYEEVPHVALGKLFLYEEVPHGSL